MANTTIEKCFIEIKNGANIKQGVIDGGYPITRIESLSNNKFNRDRMGYAGITDLEKYYDYILNDGDLLMSHINSVQFLGRSIVYKKNGDEAIIHGMNLLRLKPNFDLINPHYINLYFYGKKFRTEIARITKKSVNQASFSVTDLKKISILLPTIEIQKAIAEKMESIHKVIEVKKRLLSEYDHLIKSRFVEMFDGKGLPILKWNDVFNTTTGKLDSNAMVDAGQYPFFTCAKEIYAIDTYAFDKEALLLAGNNASGKYDVKYYKGKFNAYQRTYVLDLKQNWSYQLFKYQLEDKLEWLREQSKGSNTRYITLKILGDLDFIIPPLTKQVEFEKFCNHVDKLKFEDDFYQ